MRHPALGVALLLVLTIAGGFACGETQEAANDPAVTLQQEADRLKARSEALQKRIEAHRQAREERAERIRAQRRAARRAHLRAQRRAARAAARRAAKAAAQAEAQAQAEASCDSNYSGACLDPNASDYDCAGGSGDGPEYTGPVQVVGSDPYDLDSDGDGYACE
ncbi:MAG TPA: hypothetical protein VGO48_17215 [Conexibacter sp.]|nr:hypothetical protein [Conexibacter sp.]